MNTKRHKFGLILFVVTVCILFSSCTPAKRTSTDSSSPTQDELTNAPRGTGTGYNGLNGVRKLFSPRAESVQCGGKTDRNYLIIDPKTKRAGYGNPDCDYGNAELVEGVPILGPERTVNYNLFNSDVTNLDGELFTNVKLEGAPPMEPFNSRIVFWCNNIGGLSGHNLNILLSQGRSTERISHAKIISTPGIPVPFPLDSPNSYIRTSFLTNQGVDWNDGVRQFSLKYVGIFTQGKATYDLSISYDNQTTIYRQACYWGHF